LARRTPSNEHFFFEVESEDDGELASEAYNRCARYGAPV
jgi:hypothetical protein